MPCVIVKAQTDRFSVTLALQQRDEDPNRLEDVRLTPRSHSPSVSTLPHSAQSGKARDRCACWLGHLCLVSPRLAG